MYKNFDYIKEKLILTLKTMKEYKANFYASLISDIFNLVIVLIFYSVYMKLTENTLLNWDIIDFLTFFLIVNFSLKFRNCFFFWSFKTYIIGGQLNTLLTKPISAYLQIVTNAWKSGRVFTTLIIFIAAISVIIYNQTTNYIFALIIWFIGWIGNLFLFNSLEILKFFFPKGIGVDSIFSDSHNITRTYTFAPFENNKIISSILLGLFPMAIVAYITFQILNGQVNYFYDYIFYFIIYASIMILLNIFLWKKGLKKYEAFG